MILKVPLDLSPALLVDLTVPLPVRLDVDALVSLVKLGLELDRLVRLPDFPPPANRSNTFDPDVLGVSRGVDPVLDNRSISEFLRLSGFLRSLRE